MCIQFWCRNTGLFLCLEFGASIQGFARAMRCVFVCWVASLRGALFATVGGLLGGAAAIVHARSCEFSLCAGECHVAMVEFL